MNLESFVLNGEEIKIRKYEFDRIVQDCMNKLGLVCNLNEYYKVGLADRYDQKKENKILIVENKILIKEEFIESLYIIGENGEKERILSIPFNMNCMDSGLRVVLYKFDNYKIEEYRRNIIFCRRHW